MDSRIKILGHSIHQQLIVFPLGLLGGGVIFDVIYLVSGDDTMAVVAFWMFIAGIVSGLIAAPFGTIDWLAIPSGTRAKSIGLMHALANVVALALFIISAVLRWNAPDDPGWLAHLLAFAGMLSSVLGGWLGGELVSRLGVGVYEGAHLDAPSSLSGRPAHEHAKPTQAK